MAAPVISPVQSILRFLQGSKAGFGPAATNTPTQWTAAGLPPGLTINALTGRISGVPTEASVNVVTVYASNAEGAGSRRFYVAVEAGAMSDSMDVDGDLDVITKRFVLAAATPLVPVTAEAPAATAEELADLMPRPLMQVAADTDATLRVRLAKLGTTLAPEITGAKLQVYANSTQEPVLESSAWAVLEAGSIAQRVRIYTKFGRDDLSTVLTAGDVQTRGRAYGQVVLTYENPTANFGPAEFTVRSEPFGIEVFQ